MTIYLDIVFAVNAAADYFVLRTTAVITGDRGRRLRALLSALAGAVYAVICCTELLPWFSSLPARIAAGIGMSAVAFGFSRTLLRKTLVFFAVSAGFAGIMLTVTLISGGSSGFQSGFYYLNTTLPLFLTVFFTAYGLLTLLFRPARRTALAVRASLPCELTLHGRTVRFNALLDTGCLLTDPVSNRGVLIADISAVAEALPPECIAAITEGDIERCFVCGLNVRPVFCRGFGENSEMLPAFMPDSLQVGGRDRSGTLVAVSVNSVAQGDGICALIGSN